MLVSHNGEEALGLLQEHPVDLLIADVVMRKVSGIDLLNYVRSHCAHLPVVMITAYGTIKTAVDAIKLGAYDYLAKPFEIDEMKAVVDKALAGRTRPLDGGSARTGGGGKQRKADFVGIAGRSEGWQQVITLAEKVARSRANVLLRGESGTGKEVIARAIHRNSPRRNQTFVAVCCASLSQDLLESELFGHEKGSFTGAHYQKPGRFELADGGTLFLDEIGEVPPHLQVKLLRVLQEREFERVGGTRPLQVDVRVIAATNKDLEEAVRAGTFREDLYYRLHVVQICLPPLRERTGDIPELIEHFLAKYNRENGKQLEQVAPDALKALLAYSWPGNVRELENLVERAVVLSDEGATQLTIDLLPSAIPEAAARRASEARGKKARTDGRTRRRGKRPA